MPLPCSVVPDGPSGCQGNALKAHTSLAHALLESLIDLMIYTGPTKVSRGTAPAQHKENYFYKSLEGLRAPPRCNSRHNCLPDGQPPYNNHGNVV